MLKRYTKPSLILAVACAAGSLTSAGCRSTPGRNMFGMRSEPSPETLAGSGPTVTYPVPPSATATPEAIASVAGGTAPKASKSVAGSTPPTTEQVAGVDVKPGYATLATNMSAAQANGIPSGTPATPAGFNSANSATTKPSSYAFGAKAITPKTDAVTPNTSSQPLSVAGPGIASPSAPLTTPSTTTSPFAPPAASTLASSPSVTPSGFMMPSDSPSFAAIMPPKSPTSAQPTAPVDASAASARSGSTSAPATGAAAPSSAAPSSATPNAAALNGTAPTISFGSTSANAPSFSTASAATGYTAPSTASPVLPPSIGVLSPTTSGYMPGSTAASPGYPTTNSVAPTTQGSFYR